MNLTTCPANSLPISTEKRVLKIRTGARIFLSRIFALAVATILVTGRSRWEEPGALTPELMMLAGVSLATLAMAGRMWCSLFIAGRKNTELVIRGPYSLCRNPLYFFSLVGAVGVGLASGMVTVAFVLVLAFALYYPVVIRREEAYLLQRHGELFTAYTHDVPAFWPRWRSGLEAVPESIECHCRVFVHHLASAIWFPIVCSAVYVISILHSQGKVWPAWFVLP